jgi:hypothetical protein
LLFRRNSFVRKDILLTTTTRLEALCLKEWQLMC